MIAETAALLLLLLGHYRAAGLCRTRNEEC
jgi:hypothetical protein